MRELILLTTTFIVRIRKGEEKKGLLIIVILAICNSNRWDLFEVALMICL